LRTAGFGPPVHFDEGGDVKIESILHRVGGTIIAVGDVRYEFEPDAEGRHVAEVTDPKHIKLFESIKEGFRALDEAPVASPVLMPAPVAPVAGEAEPPAKPTLPNFPKGKRQ
jgi:hypothetical protein